MIYLRILPSTREAVHSQLERVLAPHSEEQLRTSFASSNRDATEAGGCAGRSPRAAGHNHPQHR